MHVRSFSLNGNKPMVASKLLGGSSSSSSKRSRSDGDSEVLTKYLIYPLLYKEKNIIAKGGYGQVCQCVGRVDGITYAVKKIPFRLVDENKVAREVKVMAEAVHPSIIRYYQSWIEGAVEVFSDDEPVSGLSPPRTHTLFIAMEHCQRTLESAIVMDDNAPLDIAKVHKYFRQLLEGVQYLHQKGVIHRDLSRQNVLLDANDNIKIADLGLAVSGVKGSKIQVSKSEGNTLYIALRFSKAVPEVPLHILMRRLICLLLVSSCMNYYSP